MTIKETIEAKKAAAKDKTKKLENFRFEKSVSKMLQELAEANNTSKTAVIHIAVEKLYAEEII